MVAAKIFDLESEEWIMTPRYWLLLGALAVATTQAVACSSSSDSCTDTRTCAASGAGGGPGGGHSEAGEAGEPAGGGAGKAGHGAAGAPEGDLGGEGGAPSEMGGSAGAGPQTPTLFGACTVVGKTVCEGVAASGRLSCDGSKWQPGAVCPDGELCDSGSGACAKIVAECAAVKPGDSVCRGDMLLKCGPDLVTTDAGKTCDGTCTNGACQAPICGDSKKEAGEDCDDAAATASGACVKCKNAACGDGAVYAGHEQCDDGNTVAGDGCSADCKWEPVDIAAGDVSTCARSKNGVVKCWGGNLHGQLGVGQSVAHTVAPGEAVALGTNRTAKAIAVGSTEACAILDNGDLKCWGSNEFGKLGNGSAMDTDVGLQATDMGDHLLPIALGAGRTATAVGLGGNHTCAVLDNGDVKCWGSNAFGQLGQDNDIDYRTPPAAAINLGGKAIAVSAGDANTTCALLADGTGKCWGVTDYGALSVAIDKDLGQAPRNAGHYEIGDYAGEMALLPALSFGPGLTAKQLGAGFESSCALLSNNLVKCWGTSGVGELGVDFKGGQKGNQPGMTDLDGINLGAGHTVKSLAVGAFHHCALLDDGSVKCWGSNSAGELGIGNTAAQGDDVGEMGDQLPVVPLGHKALKIAAGDAHSCALLDNGTVVCWGYNSQGQLGNGNTANAGDGQQTMKPVELAF